jgi:hypothetical protein
VTDNLKPIVAGYIARREMSTQPNDAIAISSDTDNARRWFDEHVGASDEAFQKALKKAEDAVTVDLQSPLIQREVRAEARRFQEEIFPTPQQTCVGEEACGEACKPWEVCGLGVWLISAAEVVGEVKRRPVPSRDRLLNRAALLKQNSLASCSLNNALIQQTLHAFWRKMARRFVHQPG